MNCYFHREDSLVPIQMDSLYCILYIGVAMGTMNILY